MGWRGGWIKTLTDNLLGQSGSTCFDDTSERSGNWFAVQIIEDVVFSVLTDPSRDGSGVTGMTFSAGVIVYGRFTTIQLTSGSCIAYNDMNS